MVTRGLLRGLTDRLSALSRYTCSLGAHSELKLICDNIYGGNIAILPCAHATPTLPCCKQEQMYCFSRGPAGSDCSLLYIWWWWWWHRAQGYILLAMCLPHVTDGSSGDAQPGSAGTVNNGPPPYCHRRCQRNNIRIGSVRLYTSNAAGILG